ncbi:MAG: VOC family protein [Bacteroidetes bacterium]|nr:VOC family protein [Bacteroidota bacterium]
MFVQEEILGMQVAFFPSLDSDMKVSGLLVQSSIHLPSNDGDEIYLNGNFNLDDVLERVENAGGSIIVPKIQICDKIAYIAFIVDTEGNHIGLYSNG